MALTSISKPTVISTLGSPNKISHHDLNSIALEGQSKVTNFTNSPNPSLTFEASPSSKSNGIPTLPVCRSSLPASTGGEQSSRVRLKPSFSLLY